MKNLGKYLADPATIPRRLGWSWQCWRAKQGQVTVSTWNGRLTVDRADRMIAKALCVRRSFARRDIEKAVDILHQRKWLDPDRDTVLDVGANLGMISIAMVRHGIFRRAVAIEPAPENFRLLLHNVRQNGMQDRIEPHQLGFSDMTGSLQMVLDPGNRGAHRVIQPSEPVGNWETVEVPVTTFDAFVSEGRCDPSRLGLVWMDIEGHEGNFFRGATRLAREPVPVVMEFSPRLIRASSVGDEAYLAVLRERYETFCDLQCTSKEPRPVSELPGLLEKYDHPTKVKATDILLFPER